MRILAFADTHGAHAFGMRLALRAKREKVDLLVCAGDFTQFGAFPVEAMAPIVLSERRIIVVPGNHERPKVLEEVAQAFPCVHPLEDDTVRVADVRFAGHGSRALIDPEYGESSALDALARKVEAGAAPAGSPALPLVFITHVPPAGQGLGEERRVGWAIRSFCERIRPAVVIAGHFHGAAGTDATFDGTRYLNPGPGGMIIEV